MKRYLLHTISFLPLFAQLTRVIVPTTVVGDLREAHDERGCPHGSPVDERTPRIPTALSAQKNWQYVCRTHMYAPGFKEYFLPGASRITLLGHAVPLISAEQQHNDATL